MNASDNAATVRVLQARKPSSKAVRRRVAKMIARDVERGELERAARMQRYLETLAG